MPIIDTIQTALHGHSLIAGKTVPGHGSISHGFNPATNQELAPAFSMVTESQLEVATAAAEEAFASFSSLDPCAHAEFLEGIATNIEKVAPALIERAMAETGLLQARLAGEVGRTCGQLRLFARVVRNGDHLGVRIDPAQPGRLPAARADIRQRKVATGPVAVFGASNFPLAFSVAGGDTAAALAAGCPVVFKAHNSHPGTSEIVGRAITDAVRYSGLHPGVFSLIFGPGSSVGQALVADPRIKAVAFTGSRAAGRALLATAAARPEPIPVYAEMSSVNPVFILPGALQEDVDTLANAYVASVTGSSGQLCTAPGLVFVPEGEAGDNFAAAVERVLSESTGQTMLSRGLADEWMAGVARFGLQSGVTVVGRGIPGPGENAPAPVIRSAGVADFLDNQVLQEEIFGAASQIIRYESVQDLLAALRVLEGQLTATLHATASDHATISFLRPMLERKAGRILLNGWPTGVEVGHAMVHGGPFPASSDPRSTSVGSLAIDRFLRPVAYQNFPEDLLPEPLQDANKWQLNRLIDGTPSMPVTIR